MKKVFLLFVSVIVLAGCSSDGAPDDNSVKTIELSAEQRNVVDGYGLFAYDFFDNAVQVLDGDNIVVSPWSMASLLSMCANGCDEATQASVAGVLRQGSIDDINAVNRYLYNSLTRLTPKVAVSSHRALWSEAKVSFNPAFKQVVVDDYFAEVGTFNSVESLKTQFGAWLKRTSNGLIDNADAYIDDETALLVADMLYFKGEWNMRFDKSLSGPGEFTNGDGSKSTVMMMQTKRTLQWYCGDTFRGVLLNMGNGEMTMIVMLPGDGYTVDDVVNEIRDGRLCGYDNYDNIAAHRVGTCNIELTMPRFDAQFETDFDKVFNRMGLNLNFTDVGAPIAGFKIMQKSVIKVNEDGAEGATVSDNGMSTLPGFAEGEPFVVDRPFVYIVRENSTGTVLQMGKITKL